MIMIMTITTLMVTGMTIITAIPRLTPMNTGAKP
jgi:hypothetical protein